ncbi:MAG: LysE family translocator [Rhodobacteraceae bacterium]|nr:LysE family translocator [Paracoccaceae bacterium]
MQLALFPALFTFALVASMTPGPNNVMLMASGANFGFRRTIPHMFGIALGFAIMVILVGMGLMQLFTVLPLSYQLLKVASITYLIWLAWKIAGAGKPDQGNARATPLSLVQAAAFQWVNPKAWAVAFATITTYAPSRDMGSVLLIAGVFIATSLPATTSWTYLGREISRLLTNPNHLRLFNWCMAALILATLFPVLIG